MCPITGAGRSGKLPGQKARLIRDDDLNFWCYRLVHDAVDHVSPMAERVTIAPRAVNQLDRSKLVRRFEQALERAGVHRITFQELRHTFGTRMASAGTPMRPLQHWMGHADSKTYAHFQPSDQEADAVDRAFAESRISL